jgi:hypothetical protein
MQTFWQWVANLRLAETYYGLDPAEYNELFDKELEWILQRTRDPAHRQVLEGMRGFNWMGYVAAAVRNAGFHDQRDVQERSHEVAVKLLMGRLFRGFDERISGPMDLRFKRSVGNAIRNLVEKEKNRQHYLPTVPIDRECEPASGSGGNDSGEKVVNDFRRLVKRRLGELGVAVLDVRLAGGETKALVDRPDLGSPGKWGVKRTVQQIKQLAREYAASLGDSELLRRIEKAMAAESETIGKRRATTAARQAVRT